MFFYKKEILISFRFSNLLACSYLHALKFSSLVGSSVLSFIPDFGNLSFFFFSLVSLAKDWSNLLIFSSNHLPYCFSNLCFTYFQSDLYCFFLLLALGLISFLFYFLKVEI